MAESVVFFVVERIGDLLIQEAKFLGAVRGQVEQMQIELERMQRFLKDADKRQNNDSSIKGWVLDIREIAYDAEDAIETFAINFALRSKGGFKNKCKKYVSIISTSTKLYNIGNEIEAIRTRITDLTTSLQTYGIKVQDVRSEGTSSSVLKLRRTYSHLVEEHTVGLDKDAKILVEQLVNEEKQCQVVSICGMGGLGKTTLANKIYHHDKIRRHFDAFAWICISQQFNPREVWEGILLKLISPCKEDREEISRMQDDEIARKLYQVQQEKKCLVILDDIWRVEAWDVLKAGFSQIKKEVGSKILLTTRNKVVALHVDSKCFLHEPQILTEEDGWELLQKKASSREKKSESGISIEMEKLGREMVKRCAGLPLGIVVLGGLLATKHSADEWKKIHRNIDLNLRRGTIQVQGPEEEYSGVHGVLAQSYHELSYQVKSCFLHLAHFPEDYEIHTKTLFQLWVAEGLVPQLQEMSMEEVAECYLGELIDRCMVQVGKMGSTGRVKTCRLHDLMRDLCLTKANQENFLDTIDLTRDRNENYKQEVDSPRLHRLAVYAKKGSHFSYYRGTSHLRSLLIFGKLKWKEVARGMKLTTLRCFKLLRILTLENCAFEDQKLVEEIGYLIHLRYLAFEKCGIMHLPSSIANLRYLQTLVVNSYWTIMIPNVIWKLENLRNLNLNCFRHKGINSGGELLELGKLRNLQTLRGFDTREFDVRDLINLTNLKKLRVIHSESLEDLISVLQPPSSVSHVIFNHLSSFDIYVKTCFEEIGLKRVFSCFNRLQKLRLKGRILKLPGYQHFPPNLIKLKLINSMLEEDPMPTLEKLPNLGFLCLQRAYKGNEMVCSSEGFPRLTTLDLSQSNKLERWQVEEGAMPCLHHLEISNSVMMVPDGLRFITTLRQVVIRNMLRQSSDLIQVVHDEGQEDSLYSIRHVPSIIFKGYFE